MSLSEFDKVFNKAKQVTQMNQALNNANGDRKRRLDNNGVTTMPVTMPTFDGTLDIKDRKRWNKSTYWSFFKHVRMSYWYWYIYKSVRIMGNN